MTKKQAELIQYLSNQHTHKTSTEIANALQISVRSVKNYIYEINKLYNKKIILSSRYGYELNPQLSTSLFLEHEDEKIPQNAEERSFYIIKQLILEHTPKLELFDLCDYLCISYSTIKSIIANMNKTYSAYNIQFICKNDQISIKGTEANKRKLISYVINEESKTSFIDIQQLQACFSNIDIFKIKELIDSHFKSKNCYLNDFAEVNLLLHIAIVIDRSVSGNPLVSGESAFNMPDYNEDNIAWNFCWDLENNFHIHLNRYEQFEIYTFIKANTHYSFGKTEIKKTVGKEITNLIDYYVSQINNTYLINLSDDSFRIPFSLHLKNLIQRAKMGSYINNPMADAIKLNSPVIFDIAIFISLDLCERYGFMINEDETAFLAMHIGAEVERQHSYQGKAPAIILCPNYHNLDTDLINKLMLNYGHQIKITHIVHNELELSEIEEKEFSHKPAGLLFTTIPLSKKHKLITVQISPFNLESQFQVIQDAILKNKDLYENYKLRKNFHNFFEKDLFFIDSELKNKNQILSKLCDKLLVKEYVKDKFEENVLKREEAATTAFGNIAIPHSIEMDATKTNITVAISKKGFIWNTNTVHIVFLLAINKADKQNFRGLYESLISLFSEETIIQEVINCTSFESFEKIIYQYIEE